MTSIGKGRLGLGAAAMVAALVYGAFGCELITAVDRKLIPGGTGGGGGTDGGASECSLPTDCPDPGNECLTRTCTGGKCGTSPTADGTQVTAQTAGDCKVKQCDGAGSVKEVNDDKDTHDDKNDCTDNVCTAGVPSNPPTKSGTMCGKGNGLICDGKGACVGCVVAADCPGKDDDCQTRTCDAQSVCGLSFTAAGTPTQTQTKGDCQENRCDGAGNVNSVPVSSDLPVDGNQCTDDVCTAGVPSNPPTMPGVSCSQMGGAVCDGKSACVQCVMPSSCPGQDTECQKRTCTGGMCGVMNVAAGTPTSMQAPGDCKVNQCDGAGAIVSANNDNDLPNDNNPCTNDLCTAGVPSHTFAMQGTSCGMNLVCDAQGACVGCVTAADCPGMDTECQARSCTGNACGFTFTPTGTPVMAQTPGDCKVNQCNGAGAVVTVADNMDLPVDNNTCTSDVCAAGVPSNPPVLSGVMCNQMGGSLCNGSGVCVACLLASDCPGQDTDCHARTCTMGACGTANTQAGTPTSTQMPGDCKENQCDGMGGVTVANKDTDLPVDLNQCTDDVCTAGVPSNPPSASGTMCSQMGGVVCNGNSLCVECVNGSMCASGVCTANACQAPTCSDGVKNGTETDVDCGGGCPATCASGKGCSVDADCTGAICTSGVCAQVNGCDITNATDLTGGAPTSVGFGGAMYGAHYVPPCIKVSQGTVVTFNGNFVSHPLIGGKVVAGVPTPAASGPFVPITNTGATKAFTMSSTGTFPYYCTVHVLSTTMVGVVFVVP